jgi:hypothetical protein
MKKTHKHTHTHTHTRKTSKIEKVNGALVLLGYPLQQEFCTAGFYTLYRNRVLGPYNVKSVQTFNFAVLQIVLFHFILLFKMLSSKTEAFL